MLQHSMLSPEVIDSIIDHLHNDSQSLLACSLTCKQWLPCSRYHLFSTITITPFNVGLFLRLVSNPSNEINSLVQALEITNYGGETYETTCRDWPGDPTWTSQSFLTCAKEQLVALSLHLPNVKCLHVRCSCEITSQLVHSLVNVEELELSNVIFSSFNEALKLVYAFPLLRSLVLFCIGWNPSEANGARKYSAFKTRPGVPSFHLRQIVLPKKQEFVTFNEWLLGLDEAPSVHHLRCWVFNHHVLGGYMLQMVGSSIYYLELDFAVFSPPEEDSVDITGISNCTGVRRIALCNISMHPAQWSFFWSTLSRLPSHHVEELTLQFTNPRRLDWLDWQRLAIVLAEPKFAGLRQLLVVSTVADHLIHEVHPQWHETQQSLKTGPLKTLDRSGICTFRLQTYDSMAV